MICAVDTKTETSLAMEVPQSTDPWSAIRALLRELAEVVAGLSDSQYGACESSGGGAIGGHVRHCLDHVTLLLDGMESGIVDYDRRQRGTDVERNRHAAFDAISRLGQRLDSYVGRSLTRTLRVRAILDDSGPAIEAISTLGRELMFVLSHTIHHNAMIAAAAKRLGGSVPQYFGYAPATVAYHKGLCARLRSSH